MHYQKGMAGIWAVLITVVIMLGLGGGGYYYLNKQNESKKADLQKQITDLEKQIVDLKKTTTAATPATTTTDSDLVYTNKTYNYSITFDTKWSSWKIKYAKIDGSTATYYVEVPTTDANYANEESTHDAGYASMFAISVYTPAQWTALQADGNPTDVKLAENSNYVFAWSHAQACPSDVQAKGIWDDISNVVKTFKLN